MYAAKFILANLCVGDRALGVYWPRLVGSRERRRCQISGRLLWRGNLSA
jgi:hypothetical protein